MAMGAVPDAGPWAPHPLAFVFLLASCFSSLFFLPYFSASHRKAPASSSSPFDAAPTAPFLRFRRSFLFLYSLASVMEGLASVFGQQEYADYGLSREQIAVYLQAGAAAALFIGSFLGIVSDIIGPKRGCLLFCILHLFLGVLKCTSRHPDLWITNICLALCSSAFSFCFETLMVTEHEKQGHRQDLLNETFWLMTFFESSCLIGSQGLANKLVNNPNKGFLAPSSAIVLLAIISILYIRKEWRGGQQRSAVENYRKSFAGHILKDKRIWLLAWAQTSIYFSMTVLGLLWAPTIVGTMDKKGDCHKCLKDSSVGESIVQNYPRPEKADGRPVNLSLIYPCFLGSRMLGSTIFPWLFGRASTLYTDDCLIYASIVAGVSLLIVAYDYQEIGFLVVLFCIFQACVGFILPSLARLRTMYVPNELRGGMMSFSLAPANAAILFILVQGGYHHNIENAVIFALSAIGLLSSAGCIYVLRWWRKHPRQNWRKL